jgi:hypothetical protein
MDGDVIAWPLIKVVGTSVPEIPHLSTSWHGGVEDNPLLSCLPHRSMRWSLRALESPTIEAVTETDVDVTPFEWAHGSVR